MPPFRRCPRSLPERPAGRIGGCTQSGCGEVPDLARRVGQAFLAFLPADAVAEQIAAEVMGGEPRAPFDPISMCVMEEFDTATFAQVPLRVTGDPERPVAVRADANVAYRVGVCLPGGWARSCSASTCRCDGRWPEGHVGGAGPALR